MTFRAPGRLDPDDDPAADNLSDADRDEYRRLYRKWETDGLSPDEQIRFQELGDKKRNPT